MNQYVDHILEICELLENLGNPFHDKVIGAVILGGLPEIFTPLILGIQGSQQNTTVKFVKQLLLQDGVKDLGVSNRVKQQQSSEEWSSMLQLWELWSHQKGLSKSQEFQKEETNSNC